MIQLHFMENQKSVALFGNNPDISIGERLRVVKELDEIGSLTFKIISNEEGWVAQCNEVTGIIAGGTTQNPSDQELESGIRQSIFAAFDVNYKEEEDLVNFSYSREDSRNHNFEFAR